MSSIPIIIVLLKISSQWCLVSRSPFLFIKINVFIRFANRTVDCRRFVSHVVYLNLYEQTDSICWEWRIANCTKTKKLNDDQNNFNKFSSVLKFIASSGESKKTVELWVATSVFNFFCVSHSLPLFRTQLRNFFYSTWATTKWTKRWSIKLCSSICCWMR